MWGRSVDLFARHDLHVGSREEWWNILPVFDCMERCFTHTPSSWSRIELTSLTGRLPFHPTETLLRHVFLVPVDRTMMRERSNVEGWGWLGFSLNRLKVVGGREMDILFLVQSCGTIDAGGSIY